MRKCVSSIGSTQPIDSTRAVLRHARVRDHAQRRQHRLADRGGRTVPSGSRAVEIAFTPRSVELPGDLGHQRHLRGELRAAERAVQDRHVERVHQVLVVLQPVAGDDRGARRRRCCGRRPRATRRRRAARARRSAAAPASSRAGRGRRRPGRSAPRPGTRAGARCSRWRAAVGLARLLEAVALRRRTASRGSSSGCRAPRPGRSRAWCRDGRSADTRGPAGPGRRGTGSGPRPARAPARGVAVASPARPTGCQ